MTTAITFPTRPTHHGGRHTLNGTPDRATPCHCGPDALHIHPHDTCLRCGHHPQPLIDRTWQHRARQLHRATRTTKAADARRDAPPDIRRSPRSRQPSSPRHTQHPDSQPLPA